MEDFPRENPWGKQEKVYKQEKKKTNNYYYEALARKGYCSINGDNLSPIDWKAREDYSSLEEELMENSSDLTKKSKIILNDNSTNDSGSQCKLMLVLVDTKDGKDSNKIVPLRGKSISP